MNVPNTLFSLGSLSLLVSTATAQSSKITIDLAHPGAAISPKLYGLMTEEINHSYDGGLYAELLQNRSFKDNNENPVHWSVRGGAGKISLDRTAPLNSAQSVSLRADFEGASVDTPVSVINDGYWGVPVKPNTTYTASFYARADAGFAGKLTVGIESADGIVKFAEATVTGVKGDWKKFTVKLKTKDVPASTNNRFFLRSTTNGKVWFSLVSLFPPTYKNRANGNRVDLMKVLEEMHMTYLRFPGGNYLEGNDLKSRFPWKDTLNPVELRSGHPGTWSYRSSDGLGLMEFLHWCEDLNLEPLLAVHAGYALNKEYVPAGPGLTPYVEEALEEIEFMIGDTSTKWGAVRAKLGHPKPFALTYVEIGNEDWFDRSGSYDGRFAQFYDAIKAKYPKLQLIATAGVKSRRPDMMDDHFYNTVERMQRDTHHYDNYDRKGPKIFVGEWAAQDVASPWVDVEKKGPTPNYRCALADAAWMIGLERNSDVVLMQCYAPLLVNVNPGGRQWAVNLIGYDNLTTFVSPSYYSQAMFAANKGDTILPVTLPNQSGDEQVFATASKDEKTGDVILKFVNVSAEAKEFTVDLSGARSVASTGTLVQMTGSPREMNTLTEPNKIKPITVKLNGLGKSFSHTFPAYSVSVLRVKAQ